MSSPDLIKLVAEENHVKFRSALNDILYSKLSEQISEKTLTKLAEIFDADILEEEKDEDKKPDEDGDGVPDWADKKPGKDDNADEEDEDEDEEDEDEDEEDEDEEDKKNMNEAKKHGKFMKIKKKKNKKDEAEKEEDQEKMVVKKGGKSFHFDINSHNEG